MLYRTVSKIYDSVHSNPDFLEVTCGELAPKVRIEVDIEFKGCSKRE
jgi:hypothetical protein